MNNCVHSVIFDFDYTLADSSQGITECINQALKRVGLSEVPPEAVYPTIGLSLRETFRKLAGEQSNGKIEELIGFYVEHADQVMLDRTFILPLVPRTVAALKRRGLALGVVSTKYRYRIEAVFRRENLLRFFHVIVGGEDVSAHKPDPQGLLAAVDRLGSRREATLYVGDSVTDAETAQRAAVPFVAVLSGATPREHFDGYSVRAILADLSKLPNLVGADKRLPSTSS